MNHEAFPGFKAFDARKKPGEDVVDFIKFRQLVGQGALFDDSFAQETLAKPKA